MPNREKVIKGLNDIGGFVAGRIGFEQARNFLHTIDDAVEMLKEQEADIIAMSRFLESHGWDSDSICGKNVEIVVTNGDDDDA